MLSDIVYHDYVLLICSLDAEWSRPVLGQDGDELSPFRRVLQRFTSRSWEYGHGISANYCAFAKANGIQPEPAVSPYLFNPACYRPFGHADATVLVLLDDLDPVHHLTASAITTIEDVCLGFCPKLMSLGIETEDAPFCELHALFSSSPPIPKLCSGGGATDYEPAIHDFQTTTPLLLFSKFKMDGLAVVGQSLLFQQALLRAMAREVRRIVNVLLEEVGDHDSIAAQLMTREDIQTLRCTFLDLQGSAEVGVLVFCRNYSVGVAVLAGLRALTYGSLFDAEIDGAGALCGTVNHSIIHDAILRRARECLPGNSYSGADAVGITDAIRGDHVFRWTQSVAAVAWSSFASSDHTNCHGYVEAVSKFDLAPGHRNDAEQRIYTTKGRAAVPSVLRVHRQSLRRYAIGETDLVILREVDMTSAAAQKEVSQGSPELGLIPISDAIRFMHDNLRVLTPQIVGNDIARDVVNFTTDVIVPIPKLMSPGNPEEPDRICGAKGVRHGSPLELVLRRIQQRLCYLGELPQKDREHLGSRAGRLDLCKLRREPRKYGVPISLRRSIEYLYQDYATLIADPFLFDVVLDLYDSFATLHAVLTDHLPKILGAKNVESTICPPRLLDEQRVEQLSTLIHAIDDALEHRMVGAHPDIRFRDMSIDFRGGFNQVLLAADAPMKCGLGLLRRLVQNPDSSSGTGRETVGALIQIHFVPGARFHILTLGTERWARLGFLAGDVPHVLHAGSYGNHLHEAFHLIFDELCEQRHGRWLPDACLDKVMRERLSEVFAILMSQLFICGSDVTTFRYRVISSYSQSTASVGLSDADLVTRFVEFMIRVFLGTDMVATMTGEPITWSKERSSVELNLLEEAWKRFHQMISEFSPVVPEFVSLQDGQHGHKVRAFLECSSRSIYRVARCYLPEICRGHDDLPSFRLQYLFL